MSNFNFKRRNLTSGSHLLGLLLVFAGLFALISPVFFKNESSTERIIAVGVGAIVLGVIIVSTYGGTLMDFAHKRTKEYLLFGGYKFGKWEELPVILMIKVISTSYVSTNTQNGISPTLSGKVTDFKTLLYSNAPKPEFSFIYSNREKAVKSAKNLASNLNAELVLDC